MSAALFIAACGSSSSSSSTTSSPGASTSSASASAPSNGLAISTAKGPDGTYLTGSSGRALYLWVADTSGQSACAGQCAKYWPPLTAKSKPSAASGVNAADLGMITRADGTKQVTYKGHPLYYFVKDTGPGKTTGQGNSNFGAKWWLVAPSGNAITTSGSSTAASSSTSSSGSSSGSSGGGYSSGGWG